MSILWCIYPFYYWWTLRVSPVFAHMNNVGMNILTQVILWTQAVILVKDIVPWGEITGSEYLFSFSSVRSLSRVRLFGTPWIAACQASLSITNSQSYCQIVFLDGCTNSQSHQDFMRILVALYWHLVLSTPLAALVRLILEFTWLFFFFKPMSLPPAPFFFLFFSLSSFFFFPFLFF